jgi:hypothetical protein
VPVDNPTMRSDGRVQTPVGFDEHADVRPAVEKEGQFLSHLIADGVAGLSVIGQKCNPHGSPSLESG